MSEHRIRKDNRVSISEGLKKYAEAHRGTMEAGEWLEKDYKRLQKKGVAFAEYEKRIAELEEKLKTQQPQITDLTVPVQPIKPTSDISTDKPTLAQRAETDPVLKQLIGHCKDAEERKDINKLPLPPCIYCSLGYTDQKTNVRYIFCAGPAYRKPNSPPIPVPFTACQKCYERRQLVKVNPQNGGQHQERKPYRKVTSDYRPPQVDWSQAEGGQDGGYFNFNER
jgi:hypothetical protein